MKETDWWEVKEKDRNTIKKELGDKIMFESYEKITKRAKIILQKRKCFAKKNLRKKFCKTQKNANQS